MNFCFFLVSHYRAIQLEKCVSVVILIEYRHHITKLG
jgi:hypothetical protein